MIVRKWVCTVCGYVREGENVLEKCSQCGVPASKLKEQAFEGMTWAREHEVGMTQGAPRDTMMGLRANFEGKCSEMGMYLIASRVVYREGHLEADMHWARVAFEETEHIIRFAELLSEAVTSSTKKNLETRIAAENGATADEFDLAKRAKALSLGAIHDTVHEMVKDEARHGRAFGGLLNKYFD